MTTPESEKRQKMTDLDQLMLKLTQKQNAFLESIRTEMKQNSQELKSQVTTIQESMVTKTDLQKVNVELKTELKSDIEGELEEHFKDRLLPDDGSTTALRASGNSFSSASGALDHVLLKGRSTYGENATLTAKAGMQLAHMVIGKLTPEEAALVLGASCPYRENRQVMIRTRGGREDCLRLRDAVATASQISPIEVHAEQIFCALPVPPERRQRNATLGKLAKALETKLGIKAHLDFRDSTASMSLKDKVKSAAEMVGETTAAAAAAAAVEDHDMTEGEGQEAEDMLTVVRLSRKTGKPK